MEQTMRRMGGSLVLVVEGSWTSVDWEEMLIWSMATDASFFMLDGALSSSAIEISQGFALVKVGFVCSTMTSRSRMSMTTIAMMSPKTA